MTALLLTLALFGVFWLIGLGLLAGVRADTRSLRVALTAPAVGTCVTLLPLFVFSEAGMAIEHCAIPVVTVLIIAAVVSLFLRRPGVHPGVLVVVAICVVGLLLGAWPMWKFGFNWIANANNDMANYALSAETLLHHGLLASFDVAGLAHQRDYATLLQSLHKEGSRPGADITLAAVAAWTGRFPYEVFMPLIFSFALCGACGVGALAMQAASRWWAAAVAAAFLLISPLATFGALQQLLPQVWGLGLATALFALLMRVELYEGEGAKLKDLVPIALLATGIILVYVELASIIALAYGLYVVSIWARGKVELRAVARLWIPAAAVIVIVLNAYLVRELIYLVSQSGSGLSSSHEPPTFGFTLVPIALPAIVGLLTLPTGATGFEAGASIAFALAALGAVVVASIWGLRRGIGAAIALVVFGLLTVVLARQLSDFGLYKLYMYIQPFLAATLAIWVAKITRTWALGVVGVLLVVFLALQLPTLHYYVKHSTDPIDLRNASSETLMPAFRRDFADTHEPIITVTENPTLGKLEAASVGLHPLYYISADLFGSLTGASVRLHLSKSVVKEESDAYKAVTWQERSFNLLQGEGVDGFGYSVAAAQLLTSGRCALVLPTGSEIPVNRWSLPEGSPGLVERQCGGVHDLLVFTNSNLGAGFYAASKRKNRSFYQLEPDYFYPGHSMSGVGRYLMFRVLGGSPGSRLELDLTESLKHDGVNALPPASVVGSRRYRLPLIGSGSARVFSAPLQPQTIDGQKFIVLDLGRKGQLTPSTRRGIEALYGKSVPLDPRYLVAYLRDISMVSAAEYAHLHPPAALSNFPADLANNNVAYSGLYEDGWVGATSYVVLAGGGASKLQLRAGVPPGVGGHVDVSLNGHALASVPVAPGPLNIELPVPASSQNRRVELRFSETIKLGGDDLRPAAAHLSFIGFVPAG
jgi:hypothetical protein